MVLKGGGGVFGGRGARGAGPGALPRYGSAAGTPYMLADAAGKELTGIGKAKIMVRG